MAAYNTGDIVNYLNGRMTVDEAASFEQVLASDPALGEEVEAQRKLARVVQVATLKTRLNDIHAEFETSKTPVTPIKSRNQKKTWGWIAAAAVIAGISFFSLFLRSPTEEIFKSSFRDDAGSPSLMGSHDATPYDIAMVYYKAGDYRAAESNFRRILAANLKNDTVRYYEALCLVRLEEEPKALPLLTEVAAADNNNLGIKARWYSALVLIHQKRSDEAAGVLKLLVGSRSVYAGKAAEVLAKLKEENLIN